MFAQVGPGLRLAHEASGSDKASHRLRSRYLISPGLYTLEGQAAVRASQQAKRAGWRVPPARVDRAPSDVGDTLSFNTERFLGLGWERRHFTLMVEGDGFNLWVETAERDNGHVQDGDINALAQALSVRTPDGSVNPNAGILENNATLFGDVPNYDGDGTLDILWFDITDDYPSSAPLAGYFAPEDYDPAAPPGQGNQADVLYLDTDPLLIGAEFGIDEVKQVTVQVHQQLIHFNQDPDEHPFVARGLAEWAKLLNGFEVCDGFYLNFPLEHNIAFLSWNPLEPFLGDVQRAALFTNYFAEQLGREAALALVQEPDIAAAGYRAVMEARNATRTLEDMVLDFHTANYVNDPALDPRFGYTAEACRDVRAPATGLVDASLGTSLTPTNLELRAGGVQYFLWENVRNLRVGLNVEETEGAVRLRAILEGFDGSVSVLDGEPGALAFEGAYKQATIIIVYDQLDDPANTAFVSLSAAWDGTAVETENVAYDGGQIASSPPNFVQVDRDGIQAVRFEVPEGMRLAKVILAPFFENQFVDGNGVPLGPATAPRDFRLHVWDDDGTGQPGTERLTLERTDPRPYVLAGLALSHFALDVLDQLALSTLSKVVYVGLSNTGDDDNHLVMALAPFTGDNPAFLFANFDGSARWHPLATLNNSGQALENRVIPIRAQFQAEAIDTAVDEAEARSPAVALHPNYPNPFNPNTTIRYTLPQAVPVRLVVYDVLGREVAVIIDAPQPAGDHRVRLDASAWASGSYFYTLQTPHQRLTRMMVLVR